MQVCHALVGSFVTHMREVWPFQTRTGWGLAIDRLFGNCQSGHADEAKQLKDVHVNNYSSVIVC